MEKEEKYVIAWYAGSLGLVVAGQLTGFFFRNPALIGAILALYVWASILAYRQIERCQAKFRAVERLEKSWT